MCNSTEYSADNFTGVDYDKAVAAQLKENILSIQSGTIDNNTDVKIRNFADRNGFPYEDVRKKVLDDDMFAAVFATSPGRQYVHEKELGAFIREFADQNPYVIGSESMPNSGNNAVYVIDGVLYRGKNAKQEIDKVQKHKSIDFKLTINTENTRGKAGTSQLSIFISSKYTKVQGGSQDNQKADLANFLENACDAKDSDRIYVAIADGPYYQEKDSTGNIRFDNLVALCNGKSSFIITSAQMPLFIDNLAAGMSRKKAWQEAIKTR